MHVLYVCFILLYCLCSDCLHNYPYSVFSAFFFSCPLYHLFPPHPLHHCESSPFKNLMIFHVLGLLHIVPHSLTPFYLILPFNPHLLLSLSFPPSSTLLYYSDWVLFGMACAVPEYLSSHRAPWSIASELSSSLQDPLLHQIHTHKQVKPLHTHLLVNSHTYLLIPRIQGLSCTHHSFHNDVQYLQL